MRVQSSNLILKGGQQGKLREIKSDIARTWDRRSMRGQQTTNDGLRASWKNAICQTSSLAHLLSSFFLLSVKLSAFGGCNHGKSQSYHSSPRISEKSNRPQSRLCCSFYFRPHLSHTGSLISHAKEASPPNRLSRGSRFSHPHLLPDRFTPRQCLVLLEYHFFCRCPHLHLN